MAAVTDASPVAGRAPAVVIPVGGEHTALLTELALMWGGPTNVRREVIVRDPKARHQSHDNFSLPLYLSRVMSQWHPCPVDGQEALVRQLQQEGAGTGYLMLLPRQKYSLAIVPYTRHCL